VYESSCNNIWKIHQVRVPHIYDRNVTLTLISYCSIGQRFKLRL
jgi:hypothetical protein